MNVTRGVSRWGRARRVVGVLGAVAVLAAGTVVGTASLAGAVASWDTPVDVSPSGASASDPKIAASADGLHLAAVWISQAEVAGIAQAARSSDGGVTWSTPVDLSEIGWSVSDPQISASSDGSRLVAVWFREEGFGSGSVQAVSSIDGGATWTGPAHLSDTGLVIPCPEVRVSADGFHVAAVWYRQMGLYAVVQVSTSNDSGATWSGPVTLSGVHAIVPQIAVSGDGSRLVVIWVVSDDTGARVQVATSSDGGATWTLPADLSAVTPYGMGDPRVAASDDGLDVAVVWQRWNGTNAIVQAVSSNNGGASWSTPLDLSTAGGDAGAPQLATSTDGGRLAAVWQRFDGVNWRVQAATSSTAGATWGSAVDLSPAGQPAEHPQIVAAAAGTRMAAVWEHWNGSSRMVQATTSSNAGATWSVPIALSPAGSPAYLGQLTGSVDGTRLAAVWQRGDGIDATVKAAAGVNGGPGVVGVWPVSGPDAGGTVVSLSGTGLTGASGVVFGGGAASSVTVVSDTQLTAVTPPHPAGAVDVTVTTPSGSATLPGGFTYTATPPPPPVPPVVPPPVDVTAPTAVVARPTAGVTLSSAVPVSWSGRDVGGAVAWYRVQRAVKAPGAALGGYLDWVGRVRRRRRR